MYEWVLYECVNMYVNEWVCVCVSAHALASEHLELEFMAASHHSTWVQELLSHPSPQAHSPCSSQQIPESLLLPPPSTGILSACLGPAFPISSPTHLTSFNCCSVWTLCVLPSRTLHTACVLLRRTVYVAFMSGCTELLAWPVCPGVQNCSATVSWVTRWVMVP